MVGARAKGPGMAARIRPPPPGPPEEHVDEADGRDDWTDGSMMEARARARARARASHRCAPLASSLCLRCPRCPRWLRSLGVPWGSPGFPSFLRLSSFPPLLVSSSPRLPGRLSPPSRAWLGGSTLPPCRPAALPSCRPCRPAALPPGALRGSHAPAGRPWAHGLGSCQRPSTSFLLPSGGCLLAGRAYALPAPPPLLAAGCWLLAAGCWLQLGTLTGPAEPQRNGCSSPTNLVVKEPSISTT